MLHSSLIILSACWSAGPAPVSVKAQIVKAPAVAAPRAASRSVIRTAQAPTLVAPPPPEPAAPQPLPPPAVDADPFAPPPPPEQSLPVPAPPSPAVDPGYHGPMSAGPIMPPVATAPVFADGPVGYGCPDCLCCEDDDDGCCLCGPPHPCNMFPHYAYYPKYHGHYYFRPYNYTTVFQQQQWAAAAGIDPRNPYSNKVFDCVFAGYEQLFRVGTAPVGSALPTGNSLPELEALLEK